MIAPFIYRHGQQRVGVLLHNEEHQRHELDEDKQPGGPCGVVIDVVELLVLLAVMSGSHNHDQPCGSSSVVIVCGDS